MSSPLFKLQQQLAYQLIDNLENKTLTVDEAKSAASQILQIISPEADDSQLTTILEQLKQIPQLKLEDLEL